MEQLDVLYAIADLFEKYHIPYLLTGSFASSYYAHPRSTHDIDLILEVNQTGQSKIEQALKELGNSYIIPFNHIDQVMKIKGQFNISHEETSTKVDFWVAESEQFEKEYQRRRISNMDNHHIPLISAEDLLLKKLTWCKEVFSEKHLRDCVGIWEVQKKNLDKIYLRSEAKKRHIEDLLLKIIEGKTNLGFSD